MFLSTETINLEMQLYISNAEQAPTGSSLYISMDNIRGTTISGQGISGTLVGGPTQVTGKVGQALSIGSGQYIDFGVQNTNCAGKISLCTSGGGLTVAFWFKLIDTGWVSTFNNNGGMRLFLQKYGSSIKTELHCVENGSGNKYAVTTAVNDVNEWHHITISCSTQKIGHTYLDGQEVTAGSQSSTFGGTTGELWLGKINMNDRLLYADELVLWFSELDANSVLAYYDTL